jgi:ABC-type lipoprotein export system ATPase subunit
MSEVLSLEHFSISQGGATLTMSVGAGQWLAIVGPAGSGKSHMLHVLAGHERAAQGSFSARCQVVSAFPGSLSRRGRVQSICRAEGLGGEALSATKLWEQRPTVVADLSPSQLSAAELLPALSSDADLILIDGLLDNLDPWTLSSVLALLRERPQTTVVVATHRTDILSRFDVLVVLKDKQVRFAGSPADLLRHGLRHELTITSENQRGVRAIAAPFEVSVRSEGDQTFFSATEGQELAARLLLEGYGDVELVVSRPPTIEEALLGL